MNIADGLLVGVVGSPSPGAVRVGGSVDSSDLEPLVARSSGRGVCGVPFSSFTCMLIYIYTVCVCVSLG